MEERLWWLALSLVPGVGRISFKRLIDEFGRPEEVFNASLSDLESVQGIKKEAASAIKSFDRDRELDRERALIRENNVNLLTLEDKEYPDQLREIFDPPSLLYVKGQIKKEDEHSVAIVGTRHPTRYGKLTAERLAFELGALGVTVVSGMARGIDTFSHEGALSVGGRSIAVFGSGLDVVYPPENREIMEKIIDNGAIISEFPMGTRPEKQNFPVRNRIISGLSLGTVVVEAASKSGSLITARLALEQGREVFAVPGSIASDKSRGTNNLLKLGAKLVEGVDDIIEELKPLIDSLSEKRHDDTKKEESSEVSSAGARFTKEEEEIFSLVSKEGDHIDSIIQGSEVPPSKTVSILAKLELLGLVKQYSGKIFYRER
jgi:DNA processing protein